MKLKPQYQTETYISQGGYYCIKQDGDFVQPGLVCLSPEQMKKIAKDLEFFLSNTDQWWEIDDDENDSEE